MLLRRQVLERIANGEVDLVFRRWRRPTVKTGGTLRTAVGLLEIKSVEQVEVDKIGEVDARRSGEGLDGLIRSLGADRDGDVYRVELGEIRADPRIALREDDALSLDDVAEIEARLNRLDGASRRGPWTRDFLRLLADNPHVRAQDLADSVGLDKPTFKRDVRKLKELGLTISHSPGYELSPRGVAAIRHLLAEP